MLEFHRDRFAQLLHEVPAKETILPEPKYSPYLQTVMDTVKKDIEPGYDQLVGL